MSDPRARRHEIRSASTRDLPALHALECDIFGVNAWSLAGLAVELEPKTAQPHTRQAGARSGVVAVVEGEIVGYALSRRSEDVRDVVRVAVSPRFQRLGIGTALLEALIGPARRGDCTRALLEVDAGNVPAVECYQRLGFTVIDRRRRYYPDGADALVMQRPL